MTHTRYASRVRALTLTLFLTYASRVRAEKGSSGSMGTTFPDRSDQVRRYLEICLMDMGLMHDVINNIYREAQRTTCVSVLRFSVEIL